MKDFSINFDFKPLSFDNNSGKRISDTAGQNKSFGDTLNDSIRKVDSLQKEADMAAKNLAIGKADNIHEVAIAMQKADISFRLMVQVRNKFLEAYHEVMRMQV